MLFCFLYNVALENYSVKNSPSGEEDLKVIIKTF